MSLRETLETANPSLYDYLKDETNLRELKEDRTSRQRRNFLFHRHFKTFEDVSTAVKRCWKKDVLFENLLKATQRMPTQELTARLDILEESLARYFDDEETNAGIRDFLKDLDFLRDLRNTFEIQIMDTLETFFIEHKDLHMPEYYSFMDSKYYEITRSPLTVTVMEDLQDRLHLSELIANLKEARSRWRDLIETRMDSTIHASLFDKHSRAQVLKYAGYDSLEPYMRIIPDSMLKLDNCLALARSVWNVCDRRARDKHSRMEQMNDTLQQVKSRHNDLELEVEISEQRRQEMGAKLRDLDWDALKFDSLREEYEQCLHVVTMGEIDLYELNKKRVGLYERSQKAQSTEDTHAFNCAYDRYFVARREFLEKRSEIAVVRCRADILRDHLDIDAALKCSAMRTKGGVQEECDQIDEQLESLKEELEAVKVECKALEDSIYFAIEADDQKALKAVRDLTSLSYENDQNYQYPMESRIGGPKSPIKAITYANQVEHSESGRVQNTPVETGSPATITEDNIFLTAMGENDDNKNDTRKQRLTTPRFGASSQQGLDKQQNFDDNQDSQKYEQENHAANAQDPRTSQMSSGFPNKETRREEAAVNGNAESLNPETPPPSPDHVAKVKQPPEAKDCGNGADSIIGDVTQCEKRRSVKAKSNLRSGVANTRKNKPNNGSNGRSK